MKVKEMAVVYPPLPEKYQSYGDHWLDAAKCLFGDKAIHYASIEDMGDANHDLYFFIEVLPQWFNIPDMRFRPRILYCWDSHLHYFCYLMSLCNHFDMVFLANMADVGRLRAYGADNVRWMPPGYNHLLHRPVGIAKKFEVGFIGQQDNVIRRYPNSLTRWEALVKLQEMFGERCFIGQGYYGEDYVRILNECNVILDFRTHFDIGARCYEALGMGIPVLTQEFKDFETHDLYPHASCITFPEDRMIETVKRGYNIGLYGDRQQEFLTKVPSRYIDRLKDMIEVLGKKVGIDKRVDDVIVAKKPRKKKERSDFRSEVGIVIPTKYAIPTLVNVVNQAIVSFNDLGIMPRFIIVGTHGVERPEWWTNKILKKTEMKDWTLQHIDLPDDLNFSRRVNGGIRMLLEEHENIDYLMVCNDDIVFAKDAIAKMFKRVHDYKYELVGPISNCDYGWQHNIPTCDDDGTPFGIGVGYKGATYENDIFSKCSEEFIKGGPNLALDRSVSWVACYCWLMRRDVVERHGLLDESMQMVCSDEEFCSRLPENSVGYCQDAFVFHYGAVTRKIGEKKDYEKYHKRDKLDNTSRILVSKRRSDSREIKKIVFYAGPSWEPWSFKNLRGGGIGGSETCQLHLARELSHDYGVIMYYDWDRCSDEEVIRSYRHEDFVISDHDEEDTCIIFVRQPELAKNANLKHAIGILWNHDVCYHKDNNWYVELQESVDKIVNISNWHKDYWIKTFGVPYDKIGVINDGISQVALEESYRTYNLQWDSKIPALIYSSSYDRGLDIIVEILKEIDTELTLDVYYGIGNLEKWIAQSKNQQLADWLAKLKEDMAKDGRIRVHNRVSEFELMEKYWVSNIFLYPTYFHETYCITALMAQATDCHIITRPLAALRETVADRCFSMIDGDVYRKDIQDKFREKLIRLTSHVERGLNLGYLDCDYVSRYVEAHYWSNISKQWVSSIRELAARKA